MSKLLIRGGRMIDPASGTDAVRDILIENNRIVKIAESIDSTAFGDDNMQVIDAGGRIVAPGLVDVHVHFRDPGFPDKEDITTGAAAAAKGGFTSVVMMANTKPAIDSEETLRYVLEKGATTGIHVYTCANVTMGMQGKELTDMSEMIKFGAVGFTDDGLPLLDAAVATAAMEQAAKLDMPISFHEEDPAFIGQNGINHGAASEHYGIEGSDRQAEISMIERDLKIAEQTGACVVIQHISTKEGVELVRDARKRGVNAHAEATPHHFTLTESAVIEHGTLAKMNPPLREEADRQAIIKALADGSIDLIATDHAPHTEEEKSRELTKAPSGIIGLETSFALGVTSLIESGKLTWLQLIDRMSLAPARVYKLDAGFLSEGGPADLIIADPGRKWIFKREEIASKACNSPFIGEELTGMVEKTICGGNIIYEA